MPLIIGNNHNSGGVVMVGGATSSGGNSGGMTFGTDCVREQFTLTEADITAKRITLKHATKGLVNLSLQGVDQFYGEDFTVTGNILSWDGLGLETIGGEGLRAGDKFIVEYTKG